MPTVETHAEAREYIRTNHLKVVCVERMKGGLRYQCFRKHSKKKQRHPVTITIRKINVNKSNYNHKES